MNIIDSLQNLGLSEKEAKVYIALIGMGSASVYAIAKASGLKRPTTYVIIDELVRKGIASEVPRVKKQLYQAKSPEELIAQAENRFMMAKQKLPELRALVKGQESKPRVYFFEGKEGVEQTFTYGLKRMANKEVVGFYATSSQQVTEMFDNFKIFIDGLNENGIKLRGVAPKVEELEHFRNKDIEYGRTFRTIDKIKYSPTVSIEMGDTYVKVQDFDNLQSIIIENANITKTLKQIFELVWENQSSE